MLFVVAGCGNALRNLNDRDAVDIDPSAAGSSGLCVFETEEGSVHSNDWLIERGQPLGVAVHIVTYE